VIVVTKEVFSLLTSDIADEKMKQVRSDLDRVVGNRAAGARDSAEEVDEKQARKLGGSQWVR